MSAGATFVTWPSTLNQLAQIEGFDPESAPQGVIKHYTRDLPRMVGNFVKNYGGKVEKVVVGKPEVKKIYQAQDIGGDHSHIGFADSIEELRKKLVDMYGDRYPEGSYKIKIHEQEINGYEFFGVLITLQLKAAVEKNQIPQFSRNLDPRDPHPDVERRMQEAQGTTDHPWKRRWQTFKNIVVSFRTPLVSLYGTEGHGQLKDILRVLKSAGQFGASQAYKEIYSTISRLDEAEYKVFSSNLILADLLKDTVPNEKGETVLTPETGYPFGFTSQREIME